MENKATNPPLPSLERLKSIDWEIPEEFLKYKDLIATGEAIYKYCHGLFEADPELAMSIRSIANGCFLSLQSEDFENPFKQVWSNKNGGGSVQLAELTEDHIKIFEWYLGKSKDIRITARFSDILWIKRKNPGFAAKAIESYLEKVEKCVSIEISELYRYLGILQRALVLSAQLKKKNEYRPRIKKLLDIALKNGFSANPWQVAKLVTNIVKWSPDLLDENVLIFLKDLKIQSRNKNDFESERSVLETLVETSRANKKNVEARFFEEEIAKSHAAQGRKLKNEGAKALGLTHHYESAIEAYRKLGLKEMAKDLHLELLEIQPNIKDDLHSISEPMNLSEPAKQLIDYLDANPNRKGVMAIVNLARAVAKSSFLEQGKNWMNNI